MNEITQFRIHLTEFIQRYVDDLQKIIVKPEAFFREQLDRTGMLEPALFASVSLLLPQLFYALLLAPLTFGFSFLMLGPYVFYGVSALFIASIFLYAVYRCCGGRRDFELTFRCAAYSCAAFYAWLIPVPIVNLILFTLAFSILIYFASMEAHLIPRRRAIWIAVGLAFLILIQSAILYFMALWLYASVTWYTLVRLFG